MTEPGAVPFSKGEFAKAFAEMQSAILAEWPAVDASGLAATEGDLERTVGLIVEQTKHTKALVRRQIEELYRVLYTPPHRQSASGYQIPESVDTLLRDLEQRAVHILRDLRGGVLDNARNKVADNLLLSLLISVGLGFIVGVFFMGRGRDK